MKGIQQHPEYWLYHSMKKRCFCETSTAYPSYGGRGITICERWLGKHGFQNFTADMGPRPQKHTIERLDVNGNYEPSNCVWATRKVQGNNRRNNIFLTLDGETKTATEWAHGLGLRGGDVVLKRIAKGIPLATALTERRIKPSPESMKPRVEAAAEKKRAMTHCKRGHPLSGENLHLYKGKIRVCKECRRITTELRKQK